MLAVPHAVVLQHRLLAALGDRRDRLAGGQSEGILAPGGSVVWVLGDVVVGGFVVVGAGVVAGAVVAGAAVVAGGAAVVGVAGAAGDVGDVGDVARGAVGVAAPGPATAGLVTSGPAVVTGAAGSPGRVVPSRAMRVSGIVVVPSDWTSCGVPPSGIDGSVAAASSGGRRAHHAAAAMPTVSMLTRTVRTTSRRAIAGLSAARHPRSIQDSSKLSERHSVTEMAAVGHRSAAVRTLSCSSAGGSSCST